jgi:hypothetical protein
MTHAAKIRHALQKLAISTRYAKEAETALRLALKVGASAELDQRTKALGRPHSRTVGRTADASKDSTR